MTKTLAYNTAIINAVKRFILHKYESKWFFYRLEVEAVTNTLAYNTDSKVHNKKSWIKMLALGLAERRSNDKNTSLQQCDYQWSKKFYITSASESILFLC